MKVLYIIQGCSQVFIGGGQVGGNMNLSIKTFLQNFKMKKLYCSFKKKTF